MSNIYWIGPRQSDIEGIEQLFRGSVTIYGDNCYGNIAYSNFNERINHNIDNEDCDNFFYIQFRKIIKENKDARFLFYNQEHAYNYDKEVFEHSIGVNNKALLQTLNDKARCRYLLSNIIDVIPYVTCKGKNCSYENFQRLISGDEFVFQKVKSSGGDGTYHITANSDIVRKIRNDINGDYILSPYLNGISLNIHLIISDNEVILFPASVQIICEIDSQLLYSGADFICYQSIEKEIQKLLNNQSHKIGTFLQKKGYRGVLGIDYMFYKGILYFMEVNTRFQASTQLLNKGLCAYNKMSLQEFHLYSFEKSRAINEVDFNVNYSNFVYTTNNISVFRLCKVLSSKEIFQIQYDGYSQEQPIAVNNNIYLCRGIFTRNICAISNGKLLLHPNIFTQDINNYLKKSSIHLKKYVKFALLNHGVTLTNEAKEFAQKSGTIKNAVFDAIDITIFQKIKVNVPTSCKFNSLSPFTIDVKDDRLVLLFENDIITEITIDLIPDSLVGMKTSSGVPFDSIINIATDRIRINPAPICIYKKDGTYCHFCNLPEHNYSYNINDIKEVLDYCIKNVNFRHFLIGGGTYSINGGWDFIIKISQYIKSKCSKDIYLMSVPPEDVVKLNDLKHAGITEVAFNIEIFDRDLAKRLMPGKGSIPIARYFNAYDYAVKLWGDSGNVRSLLIYGLDSDKIFLNGIEKLCAMGVEPIISIFRPLTGTVLENSNPPSTLDIFSIYNKCKEIAEKYSLNLGPDCAECQNNTLSFSE